MHYEIRSQKSSSSDPPTTGSTVTQEGLPTQTACHIRPRWATAFALSGPGHVREGRPAISISPQRPHPLPLCRSMRTVALHPRRQPHRSGIRAAIRCAIPRTRRWAGAATPTQRDTNQALDRARTASYMIKINNATSENKPPWMLGENPGPTRTSLSGAPAGAVPGAASSDTWTRLRRALVAATRAVPMAGRVLLSWLAALPRRLGDRLFTMNDAEAYWRTWRITSTHGGLGRRYHDLRFDALAECPKCQGSGLTADQPCPPCQGTGRIGSGEVD